MVAPCDVQYPPIGLAKSAVEVEVLHCFFHPSLAQGTVHVIPNIVMSSTQHVSSVYPVRSKEPCKKFDFHSASGFPDPPECIISLHISEIVRIEFPRRIRRAPYTYPSVRLSAGLHRRRSGLHLLNLQSGLCREWRIKTITHSLNGQELRYRRVFNSGERESSWM